MRWFASSSGILCIIRAYLFFCGHIYVPLRQIIWSVCVRKSNKNKRNKNIRVFTIRIRNPLSAVSNPARQWDNAAIPHTGAQPAKFKGEGEGPVGALRETQMRGRRGEGGVCDPSVVSEAGAREEGGAVGTLRNGCGYTGRNFLLRGLWSVTKKGKAAVKPVGVCFCGASAWSQRIAGVTSMTSTCPPPRQHHSSWLRNGEEFFGNLSVMLAARKIRHFDFELFDPGVLTWALYSEEKNLVVKLEAKPVVE